MADSNPTRTRLCLVTPPTRDAAAFAPRLADALSGGDVASVIIAGDGADPAALQQAAELFVPLAQKAGAAAFILNDTRIAGRARADGVHVDAGFGDLKSAIAAFRPKRMVGAGGIASRDEAMEIGEAGADYLFFGRLDGDTDAGIFPKALDLAAWWSSVTTVPAIVMGGATIASVAEAAAEGIEFVALSRAVWDDPRGPRAAVAEANDLLATPVEAAT